MGTARLFSKVLHKEIDVRAAWVPVTNTFRLGDYGVISDGVFVKMGNIDEYGVTFVKASGEPSQLKFSSAGTTVRRFVGGAEVPALPEADLDAKLVVDFDAADSFYLDAHLSVESIENLAQVGKALRAAPGWRRTYRVIFATYTGRNCTILSSRSAKSQVEISGKASALKQFELGNVEAGLKVSRKGSVGLQLVGETGVVGLRLFKLRSIPSIGGTGIRILTLDEGAEPLVEETADELADDI